MYVDEEHLESFMTAVRITETSPLILQEKSMDLFLYEEKLRHERVNALLLASIH